MLVGMKYQGILQGADPISEEAAEPQGFKLRVRRENSVNRIRSP